MNIHRLEPSPTPCTGATSMPGLSPLLTIDSGDPVTISTVSGTREVMPAPPLVVPRRWRPFRRSVRPAARPHILTGPVAVRGAKPGQVLEVDIEAIELHYDWGYI